MYKTFEVQEFIKCPTITHKEAVMLIALRSQTLRQIKGNFHTFYKDESQCPLCQNNYDSQEHCMVCTKLEHEESTTHIVYNHIYGDVFQQKEVASLYLRLIETRDQIILDSLPGVDTNTGP